MGGPAEGRRGEADRPDTMGGMPIKVLHIRDTGAMLGAESVILALCERLRHEGVEPIVGVFREGDDGGTTELEARAADGGIETLAIPCRGAVDLATRRFIADYITHNDIDLVHAHGYKEDFYALLAKRTPLIATNHLWKRTTRALRAYAKLDAWLLRRFDRIVAVSEPIREEMIEAGIGASRIALIPNGIDLQRFSPRPADAGLRRSLGIPEGRCVVAMIASLTPEKGHASALEALARLIVRRADVHLLCVGDGPLRADLAGQAARLGIGEHVTLAGARDDVPSILTSVVDVFLLNSTIEGLPMALLEAMAAGRAVVATDVGDVGRVVVDGRSGILIGPGAPLHAILERLVADPGERERLGRAARRRVGERYSSEAMAAAYLREYRGLLS